MEKARLISEFQLKIDSATQKNIGDIYKWLEENQFLSDEKEIKNTIFLLTQYTYVRPKKIQITTFIASAIIRKHTQDQQMRFLTENFSSASSPFGIIASVDVLFLMGCVDLLKIPYEKVIDAFLEVYTEVLFTKDDYFSLFVFLGPTFENYKPEVFESVIKIRSEGSPNWVRDLKDIRKNNWQQLTENRKNGGSDGGISFSIRKDNLPLIKFAATNKKFRFDQIVKFNIYEPNIQILTPPTIFDYALFCGSKNIVQHIMEKFLPSHKNMLKEPQHAHYVVAGGNLEMARMLKDNNFVFQDCLHVAAIYHQREMFNWLIEEKMANITDISPNFGSILSASIQSSNYDIALQCIKECVDVNATDKKSRAAIHIATKIGFIPTIEMLLSLEKLDINLKGDFGTTPLMIAADECNTELVKLLLSNKKINVNAVDEDELSVIAHAACRGSVDVLKVLLEVKDIDVNIRDSEGMTPLYSAYSSEEYETCKVLVEDERTDVSPDECGMNILHYAAAGIDLELLHAALKRCNVNEPDSEGRYPIHYAAGNDVEYLKAVIDAGGNLQVIDDQQRTPLHYATRSGAIDSLKLLLSIPEVDVNAGDHFGLTPLHYASNSCNINTLRTLLQCERVNPNAASKMGGATAIQVSVAKLDEEGVKAFLELDGVDVDIALNKSNAMKGGKAKAIRLALREYQKKQKKDNQK